MITAVIELYIKACILYLEKGRPTEIIKTNKKETPEKERLRVQESQPLEIRFEKKSQEEEEGSNSCRF